MKIFKCKKCGKIIVSLNETSGVCSCCHEDMVELKANSVDASKEKHVPVINKNGNNVNVVCGSELHPMTIEHYIEFMIIETSKGFNIKYLNPEEKPECNFLIDDDEKIIAVYAYCNLHGLWVNNI